MEMGPPQGDEMVMASTSSLLHASKSDSNLLLSIPARVEAIGEEMVTSTPAQPPPNQDHNFQTPRRGVSGIGGLSLFGKSSSSGSRRLVRTSSEISSGTPGSGPRFNPFDSQISVDRLHLPTCSPSVFSIVVSPSQESSNSGGKFWSLDQQARLFPAQISDDSPWKQELAVSSSRTADLEDKTQEAIDLYFSKYHTITSPEDVVPVNVKSMNRSVHMESLGNSPNLTTEASKNSSSLEQDDSVQFDKGQACQSVQTYLSFPPVLPPDVETILKQYGLADQHPERGCRILEPSVTSWGNRLTKVEECASNSTLRRKLFAGMMNDDDDIQDSDEDIECDSVKALNGKENCESTAMVISPGKVIRTPTAKMTPSPNKSLSWSLSPVSRKKRPNARTTPVGSSTPTRL